FFFSLLRPPPLSTLFPYTTLFRSPPGFQEQLFDDILRKRNRHLLEEIHTRLPQSEIIIVPWGVAHMPEIAEEFQKAGFRLGETRSEEHTSELQSRFDLVCRLLLEK